MAKGIQIRQLKREEELAIVAQKANNWHCVSGDSVSKGPLVFFFSFCFLVDRWGGFANASVSI